MRLSCLRLVGIPRRATQTFSNNHYSTSFPLNSSSISVCLGILTSSVACMFVHDATVAEHDGSAPLSDAVAVSPRRSVSEALTVREMVRDRKSTRLNSSHSQISYAVFCLKK